MFAFLTRLENIKDLDTLNWNINFNQILTPKRGVNPYIYLTDRFFESPDEKYACLVYTIFEPRMMSYVGLIAIFENKQNPALIANPKNLWFSYQGERTLYFKNEILFIRKEALWKKESLSGTPFLVIDLKNKKFGFINFDFSSIYYSPVHVENTLYKFKLDTPKEIENSRFENYDGKIFDLAKTKFYEFDKLNSMIKIYRKEEKCDSKIATNNLLGPS